MSTVMEFWVVIFRMTRARVKRAGEQMSWTRCKLKFTEHAERTKEQC